MTAEPAMWPGRGGVERDGHALLESVPRSTPMVSTLISDLHGLVKQDFRGNALRDVVLGLVPHSCRRVLDLGCGAGFMAIALAERGHDVTAIDIDPDLVRLVDAGAVDRGVLVKTAVMSALDIWRFAPSSFDAVVCLDVLEHLEDDGAAMRLSSQALRPGGVVVASVPAGPWLYGERDRSIGHHRRYTKRQVADLLADAGFQVEFVRCFCMSGLLPYFFFEKVLRRPIYDGLRRRESPIWAGTARLLRNELRMEWKARVPLGLTLIGRAHTYQ